MVGFNGAALRRERRLSNVHGLRLPLQSFNGAALRRERRPSVSQTSAESNGTASMGPLSEESGDATQPPPMWLRQSCFNGAALRRERRLGVRSPVGWLWTELQWGRSPKRAETDCRSLNSLSPPTLQWGRSPKRAETGESGKRGINASDSFNGAALRRERRRRPRHASKNRPNGFNGAALRRERRPIEQRAESLFSVQLQWGRSPKRAETGPGFRGRLHLHRPRFNGAALRRERRPQASWRQAWPTRMASMGPLSEESGDPAARREH